MKKSSLVEAEIVPRSYGVMKMLAGGYNLKSERGDLRILEIDPGKQTSTHYHKQSESIFHIVSGELQMRVNSEFVALVTGDTILIEPHEVHTLRNIGSSKAIVVEAMAPPYSGRDIFFVEDVIA